MTRPQIERISSAKPVCKTFDEEYGDGRRYVGLHYKQRNGRYTHIEIDNINTGGPLRLSSKEFGVGRYRCL